MYKLFLPLILLLAIINVTAQNSDSFFKVMPIVVSTTPEWAKLMYSKNPNVGEVEDLYRLYYKTHEFVKTTHTQNYKHWIRLVEPLLDENGFIKIPSVEEEDATFQKLKSAYKKSDNLKSASGATEWTAMGPFETFKQNTTQAISWHKNIYSIDRSLTNANLLICGTESGGVYKTIDKAQNWTLITKGEPFAGTNSAVKIHPTNENSYLVASNSRIYQTTDGGTTWTERHYTAGEGNEFKYSPTNSDIVFHTSTGGLFKSTNGGVTWTQVYSDKCWDIDFHPADGAIVYLLKSNNTAKRAELFKSTDGGTTWAIQTSGWYDPSVAPAVLAEASDYGGKIAVSIMDPNTVSVCLIGTSKVADGGWIGVYKSTDSGSTWANTAGQDGAPFGSINGTAPWNVSAYGGGVQQGFFNFDFEASQTVANKFWCGTIRLSESSDGCQTWTSIGAAETQRLQDIHADIQDIEVIGNEIWVATDGGVDFSTDQLMSHVALNKGIQAAEFWGFNTGWNEDTYTGGKYHDGTTGWYANYGNKAYNIGGVEEPTGYVHPVESRKLLYRTNYNSSDVSVKTIPTTFGGNMTEHTSLPVRPNESFWPADRSGVYYDPRYADHIYVGFENKILKSTDGGANFNVLYTFPGASGLVYEIEISRSNPNVLYAVYNEEGGGQTNCSIWKSVDTGKTWTKTTDPSGNRKRFRISIHPEDENKVWICSINSDNNEKVYSTSNGGTSWDDKTTSMLNGEGLADILYQGGTNDVVYVVSNSGAFYWDAPTSNWVNYSTGLPAVAKAMQINPFYRDGELRFASKGRGVWARAMKEPDFLPIAQPITYDDTVLCAREVVQFDCYSILNHSGASWEWTITPAPQSISSTTARNPTVVFGADGSYDVSLKVTDGNGHTNTKTIPNMVTVKNGCDPDEVAGLALSSSTTSSYASIPNMGLTSTNTFSVSAWIKPNGIQPDYTGIVFNNSNGSGLNLRPNNELAFHWNGDKWSWSSGLTVPANQWSHVALVVEPTGVTVYLNGDAKKNTYTVPQVAINDMKIGRYQNTSARTFNGEIDEVCIWSKSLTQNEIRELRHLTRTGTTPFTTDLLAYYQFNLANNTAVMDKIGSKHGALVGAATKVTSTAPVGGGSSDRLEIDADGIYNFPNTETSIDFDAFTPEGEIVVTRIYSVPNLLPSSNLNVGNYWIINNYGDQVFDPLLSIKLKPKTTSALTNPAVAKLYARAENEHQNNWVELCSATDITADVFNYTTCDITNTHQFFIQEHSGMVTWTGDADNVWANAANWNGGVPDATKDALIPAGLTNYPIATAGATCNNLTIESTGASSGSLLGQSFLTLGGTTTIKRQMSGNRWHLVASSAPGQTIASFLAENTNVPTKNTDERGMMDYNEVENKWNDLFSTGTTGNIVAGKAYSLRTDADGTVSFTGTLQQASTVSPVVSRTDDKGWNAIGNPYPSAIAINEKAGTTAGTSNFIVGNSSNLDGSFTAIYVWEQDNNAYTPINLGATTAFYAQLGQGFMVKAATGATQVDFTSTMQTHQPTAVFKSATVSAPQIILAATIDGQRSTTRLDFMDNMSLGLDVGFDAGMFKTGFDLYTKLVNDNGVDFGLQYLPYSSLDKVEVSLGLDSKVGGAITFSSENFNIPAGYNVVLEDRFTNTFTSLNNGEIYTTEVEANTKGKGRFYLHTTNLTTSILENGADSGGFTVYNANRKIYIAGQVKGKGVATLFDIMGRKIKVVQLEQTPLNLIPTQGIKTGIYMLNIQHEGGSFTQKVPVIK